MTFYNIIMLNIYKIGGSYFYKDTNATPAQKLFGGDIRRIPFPEKDVIKQLQRERPGHIVRFRNLPGDQKL